MAVTSRSAAREKALRRFGELLTASMRERGLTDARLAAMLGAGLSTVWKWRTGQSLPRLITVDRMADELVCPELLAIVVSISRRRCLVCRRWFVSKWDRRDEQRMCGRPCWQLYEKRRKRGVHAERSVVARRRLAVHQDAVTAFCRGCEPLGVCRQAACELRPVSPLPLIVREGQAA